MIRFRPRVALLYCSGVVGWVVGALSSLAWLSSGATSTASGTNEHNALHEIIQDEQHNTTDTPTHSATHSHATAIAQAIGFGILS